MVAPFIGGRSILSPWMNASDLLFPTTGFAAHYSSWRALQAYIGIAGLLTFFLVFTFFPETSHVGERGLDKLQNEAHPKWRPVILNPLRPLGLLRSPNLLFVVGSLLPFIKKLTQALVVFDGLLDAPYEFR